MPRSTRLARLAVAATCAAVPVIARAAPPGTPARAEVRGRVLDALGAPVANATVSAEGARSMTVTDSDGQFVLAEAPLGASVVVNKPGYAPGYGWATATAVDIVLVTEGQASETITVHGEPPPPAPGAARLSRDELRRLPGTGGDLMQAVSAMPGVASFPLPLGASGVVIRGSSPGDSKVLIDDFEVPALYHYLGFRAIIPEPAIDSLEYIPGGFDVARGRATSGIIELTTRAGGPTRHLEAETSTGDLGIVAEGPVGAGRYMIAARRSVIDLLLPALLPGNLDLSLTTVPRYYDEQLRFDYPLSPSWDLHVSSVGSDDKVELYASRDRNADKHFLQGTRFARATVAASYHDGPWTAKLALSGIVQEQRAEIGLYQRLDATAPAVTARATATRTGEQLAGLIDPTWQVGGEVVRTRYDLDLALPQEVREGEQPAAVDPGDTSLRFHGRVTTTNYAAWTMLGATLPRPTGQYPQLRLTAGLRLEAYTRAHDLAVQPRGELAIELSPTLSARMSAGAYARPPENQTELLTRSLRGERATQLIAGLTYEPVEGIRFQGSLYGTDRRRLITRGLDGTLGNDGRGTTYGGELLGTVRHGPWFAWLSYAYSRSTRIDRPDAARRLFDFDQPHNLNVLASYQLGRWQLGARFRLSSGLPYTPVESSVFDSDANLYRPVYGPVNSQRAELHHQLDVRLERTARWGPIKLTRFLDIENVYFNQSVAAYFYGFDYTQRAAFRGLPIMIIAGVRGDW